MVKDNWSSSSSSSYSSDEQHHVQSGGFDAMQASSTSTSLSSSSYSTNSNKYQSNHHSLNGSLPINSVQSSSVWGEYISKSNLIDMHFC